MKRLMISGFGCPKDPWISLLGPTTQVISFHDVLSTTQSNKAQDWAQYVASEIQRIMPDSIVCHDFGGISCLQALILLRQQQVTIPARLTLLNTAFRDFDVFKNPHPLLMQMSPWSLTRRMVQANGGELDPKLKHYLSTIRSIYRRVIAGSVLRKLQNRLHVDAPLHFDLGLPAQIIASTNDPFIHLKSLQRLQADFSIQDFHIVDYGHFPYSSKKNGTVRDYIHQFEEPIDANLLSMDRARRIK